MNQKESSLFDGIAKMKTHEAKSTRTIRQASPRDIAANPQWFHSRSLRTLAWAALKADRGQTVHQHRLQALHAAQPSTSTTQGI
jgi:hypothetical protein